MHLVLQSTEMEDDQEGQGQGYLCNCREEIY